LKEELKKLLPAWGWKKDTNAFLEYWFTSDIEVDKDVLKVVEEYRKQGIRCYLATDQEKYRAEYLRKELGLEKEFDGEFFSYELKASKSDPGFFREILAKLGMKPEEVAYRDDDKKNVEVAKELGIEAKFYEKISDLKIDSKEFKLPRI